MQVKTGGRGAGGGTGNGNPERYAQPVDNRGTVERRGRSKKNGGSEPQMLGEGRFHMPGCGSLVEDDSRLWLILAQKGRKSDQRGAFYLLAGRGNTFLYEGTVRINTSNAERRQHYLATFACQRRLDLGKVACPVRKGTASYAGYLASHCVVCLMEVTLPPAHLVAFSPKHNIDHLVPDV